MLLSEVVGSKVGYKKAVNGIRQKLEAAKLVPNERIILREGDVMVEYFCLH